MGSQSIPRGLYATTTHIGPMSTLEGAYRVTFERVRGLRRYRVVGLPAIEIYHAARLRLDDELNQTELCIPVEER